jgi:hypothetical protein
VRAALNKDKVTRLRPKVISFWRLGWVLVEKVTSQPELGLVGVCRPSPALLEEASYKAYD